MPHPTALSIAGSDPSGGAGVQADLKAFADHQVYGMAVLAALTAQNTRGVTGVMPVPPAFLRAQLQAVLADIPPGAIKIGMLGDAGAIAAVAEELAGQQAPVVLDPVMVATSGDPLLAPDAEHALLDLLVPLATVVTPNKPEAARLGLLDDPAGWSRDRGVAVLLKGGHDTDSTVVDVLFTPQGGAHRVTHPRIDTRNTHGTGCTLSSALAARLARGEPLADAAVGAVRYVHALLERSAQAGVGGGNGPLLHGTVGRW